MPPNDIPLRHAFRQLVCAWEQTLNGLVCQWFPAPVPVRVTRRRHLRVIERG